MLAALLLIVGGVPASAQIANEIMEVPETAEDDGPKEYLIFCNDPEKMRMPGVYADTALKAGDTYTIFYHYKNATNAPGPLVIAFHGASGKPLNLSVRRGIANPHFEPPVAGRQAMARYLSRGATTLTGRKGFAQFSYRLPAQHTASGMLTVRADQDTRMRIYFRHREWTVKGMRTVKIENPRRDIAISLHKDQKRQSFRIGEPEAGMSRRYDGTYGILYAFKVDAPAGRKVRISFSPRGGQSGLVGLVNGYLTQTAITDAPHWKVFSTAKVGANGRIVLMTAPFGGVFYPVEIVFSLL